MPVFPSIEGKPDLMAIFKAFPQALEPLLEYHDIVLRGESPLTEGERELIAAYVSSLNGCDYCYHAHSKVAVAFGIEAAAFEQRPLDIDSAVIPEALRPLLHYAKVLTESPHDVGERQAQAVYDAGWSEQALYDTICVCALFNFMNRLVEGSGIKEYTSTFEMSDAMRRRFRYRDILKSVKR